VYQSRSGPAAQPWLEPDICDVIEGCPRAAAAVAVVPLGFVSDHMEVLWDLDTEAKDAAAEAGLAFVRTPTPGISDSFVAGIVDLVQERLEGRRRRTARTSRRSVPRSTCAAPGAARTSAQASSRRRPASRPDLRGGAVTPPAAVPAP
jgi:ferrochelatase